VSRRVPARKILRSEWTKLRTLRTAWVCVLLYAAVVAVGGYTSLSGTRAPEDPATAVALALVGFAPAQLVLVALGALVVAGEYRSGTVLVALTAVPRRTRWLVAKTVVVVFWVAVLTALLAAACVVSVPTLTAGTLEIRLTEPVVLRPVGLQVASAVLVTILGVGLGALLRSTLWATAVGALLVLVAPLATAPVANERIAAAARFWPTLRVGEDDVLTVATRGSFGVPAGGDVLLAGATGWRLGLIVGGAWALALWVLGVVVTERRDA
jgi:ABC-type transport system involved in multi-copper enzyme maturation permease subunit